MKGLNILPRWENRRVVEGNISTGSSFDTGDFHSSQRGYDMNSMGQCLACIARLDGYPHAMTSRKMFGQFACNVPVF